MTTPSHNDPSKVPPEALPTETFTPHQNLHKAPHADKPPASTQHSEPATPTIPGYDITGRLGEGGMGVVWTGIQLSTKRPVAVKFLSAASFGSHRAKQRFTREVELAASLQHPHIARVYDSGLDKGVYYYAMELVDGLPLDTFVRKYKLSTVQTLKLMAKICFALQFAHQKGVIHRDLKPSNILVSKDGQPHILDFGLAKDLTNQAATQVSIAGEVAGTPAFMSPEQAQGETDKIDTRSDIYALGAILYLLLTRKHPHDLSGSAMAILRRIAEQEIIPPRQALPALHGELEAILLKALAKEPENRYPSARELASDLQNYLSGDPITAKPATTLYFLKKKIKKHRGKILALAGSSVLFLVMGLLAILWVGRERHQAAVLAEEKDQAERIRKNKADDDMRIAKYQADEKIALATRQAQEQIDLEAQRSQAAQTQMAAASQIAAAATQQAELERQRADDKESLGEITRAQDVLRQNSTDPDANLTLGRFRCFIGGDWDEGLVLFARSADPILKSLAVTELARPPSTAEELSLADGWWNQSLKESGLASAQIRLHAAAWYEFSAPSLAGPDRQRARSRSIDSIARNATRNLRSLFPLIDLSRDKLGGVWSFNGADELVSTDKPNAKVEIPYCPPAEYDLQFRFSRTSGNDALVIVCPFNGLQFAFDIGASNNTRAAFVGIGSVTAQTAPASQPARPILTNGRVYSCLIKIRKIGVQAFIDDQLVDQCIDLHEIRLPPAWGMRRPSTLGLGTALSAFQVDDLQVREISGPGSVLPRMEIVAGTLPARGSQTIVSADRTGNAQLDDQFRSAKMLYDAGDYARAEPAYRQLSEAHMRLLGPDNRITLNTQITLSVILAGQKKFTDAERIAQQVYAARKKLLGEKHSDTLYSLENIAFIYSSWNRLTEAEQILKTILPEVLKQSGPNNLQVVEIKSQLGHVYIQMRNFPAAEPLLIEAFQGQCQMAGIQNSNTQFTLSQINLLAQNYDNTGRSDRAQAIRAQIASFSQGASDLTARNSIIEQSLRNPLKELVVKDKNLESVLQNIASACGIYINPNWNVLQAVGVSKDAPINLTVRNVGAGKALQMVLAQASRGKDELEFAVLGGSVQVSTRDALTKETISRITYDVRKTVGMLGPNPNPNWQSNLSQLITMIKNIEPGSWRENGGVIGFLNDANGLLYITQCHRVHRQIALLLLAVDGSQPRQFEYVTPARERFGWFRNQTAWIERSASRPGTREYIAFNRITVGNDEGTIVQATDVANSFVFIPDTTAKNKWLLTREGSGPWTPMALMENAK